MTTLPELLSEVEQLPAADKWQLVKHVLQMLEQEQTVEQEQTDWPQFLRETYGTLRDTPIKRWPQGDYEERETLE